MPHACTSGLRTSDLTQDGGETGIREAMTDIQVPIGCIDHFTKVVSRQGLYEREIVHSAQIRTTMTVGHIM